MKSKEATQRTEEVFVLTSTRTVHRLDCGCLRRLYSDGRVLEEGSQGPRVVDRRVSVTDLQEMRSRYHACLICQPTVPGQRIVPRVRAKCARALTVFDVGRIDAVRGEIVRLVITADRVEVTFLEGDPVAFAPDDELSLECGGAGVIELGRDEK